MYEFLFLHSDALSVLLHLVSFAAVLLLPAAALPVQVLTACFLGSAAVVLLKMQRLPYVEYAGIIMLLLMILSLSEAIQDSAPLDTQADRLLRTGMHCRLEGRAVSDSIIGTGGRGEVVEVTAGQLTLSDELQITQSVHLPCVLQAESAAMIRRGEAIVFSGRIVSLHPLRLQGEIERVHPVGKAGQPMFSGALKRIRGMLQTVMIARLRELPDTAAVLLTALLAGHRHDPDHPDLLLFRIAGCAHMLALSGMHLHILAMMLYAVLLRVIPRRVALSLVVVLLGVYIAVVGMRPALLRSYLFFIVSALIQPARVPGGNISLLTLVMLLQAICTKGEDSLSFMLSYTAVFGILVLATRVAELLPGIIPACIRTPVAAAAAAFSATMPFTMNSFGILYPQGIVCSLLVTPVVALLMITGFISLLPILHGWRLLRWLLEFLSDAVIAMLRIGAAVPGVPVTECPGETAGIILLLVLTAMYAREYAVAKGKQHNDTLRLTGRTAGVSCRAGTGNEQKVRSEFSRLSRSQAAHH